MVAKCDLYWNFYFWVSTDRGISRHCDSSCFLSEKYFYIFMSPHFYFLQQFLSPVYSRRPPLIHTTPFNQTNNKHYELLNVHIFHRSIYSPEIWLSIIDWCDHHTNYLIKRTPVRDCAQIILYCSKTRNALCLPLFM